MNTTIDADEAGRGPHVFEVIFGEWRGTFAVYVAGPDRAPWVRVNATPGGEMSVTMDRVVQINPAPEPARRSVTVVRNSQPPYPFKIVEVDGPVDPNHRLACLDGLVTIPELQELEGQGWRVIRRSQGE